MILMSQFLVGEVPFKTVYLHGLVRNDKGEKISKSLGGNVDPIEIADTWGTDALRMALIVGVGPGSDSKLSNEKLKAYKNFANKLWNMARFVMEHEASNAKFKTQNSKLIQELDEIVKDVTLDMDNYRFYLAAEKIYAFTWHEFADIYIEEAKKTGDPEKFCALHFAFCDLLKLLHPFMPFITEEIWQTMRGGKTILMIEEWPV